MKKKVIKPAKTVYFKLDGTNKIKPKAFSGKEIATIILNLEESCKVVALAQNPELDEKQLYLSLIEVVNESAGLKFYPNYPKVAAAFLIIASSIAENKIETLPPRAINNLKEIQKVVAHKEGCVGNFISGRTKVSSIDKHTEIEIPAVSDLEGETILYGKIQKIGGVEPKVVLKLHNGDSLSLDITEDLARTFGARIYREVGLKGIARWSYADHKILTFRVESLTEFENTPIDVAFQQLSGSIGKYWDDIEDVEEALLTN